MTEYKILFENNIYVTIESTYEINTYNKVGNGLTGGFKGVDLTFFENLQKYITDFQNYWHIPNNSLDYSIESLEIIDNIIIKCAEDENKWVKIPFPCIDFGAIHLLAIPKEVMYGIVAYVGEVIIKQIKGYWHLLEEEREAISGIRYKVINPIVMKENNTKFNFANMVMDLFTTGDDFLVAVRISVMIDDYRKKISH